jgi:hypothetical protein
MTIKPSQLPFPTSILRRIACCILSLMTVMAHGQDLIVSTKGDSIHCRITEIKTDHIRYVHVKDEEVTKAFIPLAWVVTYQQNYYPYSEIDNLLVVQLDELQEERTLEVKQAQERKQKSGDAHSSFLLSGGWSQRIAELKNRNYDDETLAYARALQSGWNFGLDARFPISPRNGFGLKYSAFFSRHLEDFLKSTVWIHYAAPTFNGTIINKDSTRAVMLGFGVGLMRYKETTNAQPPIQASGNHFGFSLDLGYDFGLKKASSPFVRFSFFIGNILSATVTQGSNTVSGRLRIPENLSRFDLSVGMRFNEKG